MSFVPSLDVPHIEWAKLLGVETDEMYADGFYDPEYEYVLY